MDDHPLGIFGRWCVGREGDLTRASAVDCGTVEREDLLLSDGHVRDRGAGAAGALAWEITS